MGLPDRGAHAALFAHMGVANMHDLIRVLNDDIVPVELPYHSPVADAIYAAFDFAKRGRVRREHRTLNAPGFFEDHDDVARIDEFDWPDPAAHIDPGECRRVARNAAEGRAVLGVIWSAFFQDACAAFGLETAMVKMYTAPDLFRAIVDRIVAFYLRANEIFYEATDGLLDGVLIGNDYGSQRGLMLSPEFIREFAMPGTRLLVEQAHSYGLKVIHHLCGGIRDIIADLIELSVDCIHPIQALAAGMEPRGLKADFGDRVAFCGGVDAQNLLVRGSPDEVRNKVWELCEIFPTGLIISPSHEAILPDTPPENVKAMIEAARSGSSRDRSISHI